MTKFEKGIRMWAIGTVLLLIIKSLVFVKFYPGTVLGAIFLFLEYAIYITSGALAFWGLLNAQIAKKEAADNTSNATKPPELKKMDKIILLIIGISLLAYFIKRFLIG